MTNAQNPIAALPRGLVAILRGLEPKDAAAVAEGLIEAGFRAIEIPLNSPDPYRSIETVTRLAPKDCLVGAGTVLNVAEVERLHGLGARLVISPNCDTAVIAASAERAMVSMPGVFTPTEAFAAIAAGATALKFFPASVIGPAGIAAMRAVLPAHVPVGAVGGVSEADFAAYGKVGVRVFGLGSSLFRAGDAPALVVERGKAAVAAYDAAFPPRA
ncbi:2-dehydro-3-deoxy-6-phosphogalactonate aldolase [Aurantimonas sp. Leaf443]|uniref:2-dehydro-3-deoxy-6-phosphogalactonate aldolase n=1 Tax=Aurantimonas sp. Leaf443 TaxID=1736378 RepID=UPI0007017426|nr:2-dehydro-3-deoxy-6-phosphogalactonate aldolase [Aurantimonas sp. Leaf443]KQT82195.1 2-dehydro-3-deoxy-6-phosphogalactonate aldolase [Aurantimonas sp. Leaf443]